MLLVFHKIYVPRFAVFPLFFDDFFLLLEVLVDFFFLGFGSFNNFIVRFPKSFEGPITKAISDPGGKLDRITPKVLVARVTMSECVESQVPC